jgi:O-antigen/teichoic acid export membrane protein
MIQDNDAPPTDRELLLGSLPPPSVGAKAAGGAVWFLSQTIAGRVVQLISQIALSWLLLPKDFGVVSLTYTLTTIVGALFSFGVADVVLQRQRKLRLWLSQGFWLSIGAGCASAVVVIAASPIAAAFYHAPEIIGLSALIALSMPLSAISAVPSAILRANLNFRVLAIVGLLEVVGLQSLTLFFAFCGMAAFSFVAPVPLIALGRALLLWYLASPIVITKPRLERSKLLIANSLAVTGVYLSTGIVSQGASVVLGAISSSTSVGLYYFASRIAVQPLLMLAGSFSNVLFPALSQFRDNNARQRTAALKACHMISLIVTPACFLQAALAGPVVRLLFPSRWIEAVPLIQILSIGLAFDAVSWAAGPLLHARGEFKRSLLYSFLQIPIFFILVGCGGRLDSAIGVALGVAVFYSLIGPGYTYLIFRPLGVRLQEIAYIYLIPLIISAVIVGCACMVSQQLTNRPLGQAGVTAAISIPAYILVGWYLEPATFREIFTRLSTLVTRKVHALGG